MVLHGGDLFHTPDVSNNFTGKIANIINSWGVDTYVTPGNHDLYGYNINTLYNTKLGLLATTGVINILDRAHPLIIKKGAFKLCIDGQEYYQDIDKGNVNDFGITDYSCDLNLLVYHGMLMDHAFFKNVPHTLISNVSTGADLILAGHYHPGFTDITLNDTTYCNPGSMLRIENTVENRNNTPKVAVVDIDEANATFSIKYVQLSEAKPGDEVFIDRPKTDTGYANSLNQFHKKLQSGSFTGVNLLDMIDEYCKTHNEDIVTGQNVKDRINKFSALATDNGYIPEATNIYMTKVEIYNFQTHTKKIIDFVNGLNVIKGESNSGKTAILRAIYWALYDKPNGSDFIKTGTKSCRVRVHLSNGYMIERKRTRSSSGTFSLIDPNGVVNEFKGFSNNIPLEITNAHQMPELKINGSNYRINIASQLDQPFLVGNSPAERVSMIGSLVDADRADEAKKEFNSEKRKKEVEKKQITSLIDENKEKLKQYDYLDNLQKTISILETAISKLDIDEIKLDKLKTTHGERINLSNELSGIIIRLNSISIPDKTLMDLYKDSISKIDNLYSLFNKNVEDLNELNNTSNRINDIGDVKEYKKILNLLNKHVYELETMDLLHKERINLLSQTFEFDYDIKEINGIITEYKDGVKKVEDLCQVVRERNSIKSIDSIDKDIDCIQIELKQVRFEKDRLVSELEKEDSICPYCKQKIDIAKALG